MKKIISCVIPMFFLVMGTIFAQSHFHGHLNPGKLDSVDVSGKTIVKVIVDSTKTHTIFYLDTNGDSKADYHLDFGPSWYKPVDTTAVRPTKGQTVKIIGGKSSDTRDSLATIVVYQINGKIWRDSTLVHASVGRRTFYGKRTLDDYYFAQFSDKAKPVYNKDKNLLGFVGMNMGEVQFNNSTAKTMDNKVSFHDHGNNHGLEKDTTIGINYIFSTKLNNKTSPANFPYNSSISFKLNQSQIPNHVQQIQLDMPTPKEIIGDVLVQGNSSDKNLKVSLAWNGQSSGQIDVVIGKVQSATSPLPLFKITGNDNGKMILPQSIVDKLVLENSKELVVTLIRKNIKEGAGTILNDNYIIAQSIHNIKIQLP